MTRIPRRFRNRVRRASRSGRLACSSPSSSTANPTLAQKKSSTYGPTGCCRRKEAPSCAPRRACQSFCSIGDMHLRRVLARAVIAGVLLKRDCFSGMSSNPHPARYATSGGRADLPLSGGGILHGRGAVERQGGDNSLPLKGGGGCAPSVASQASENSAPGEGPSSSRPPALTPTRLATSQAAAIRPPPFRGRDKTKKRSRPEGRLP